MYSQRYNNKKEPAASWNSRRADVRLSKESNVPKHTHVQSGIRRGPRATANFTTLRNGVINDDRLSFRARGVLMHLLSKPAEWKPRSIAIAAQSPTEGRDAIRTAMRELEQFGYLTLERVRDADGTYRMVQIIHEVPVTEDGNVQVAPGPGNPEDDSSGAGESGSTQRICSPRTDTNTPDTQAETSASERTPKRVGVKVSAHKDKRFAGLEAACRDKGLAARWDRLKPEQAELITGLQEMHGIDALAKAAVDAHRPGNPTLYAQGWINGWYALPAPRVDAPEWSSCGRCDEHGWIPDPTDHCAPGLLCPCARSRTLAAA